MPDAAPPPTAHGVHTLRSHDLDALASAQPGWQLQYEQLSPGRFEGELQRLQLPGLCVLVESSSHALRQQGRLTPGVVGFALGQAGAGGACHFQGRRVPADALMIGSGDELDLVTPDQHQLMALAVDAELLAELWPRLYQKSWSAWLDQQVVVPARPRMAAHVRAAHVGLLAQVAAQPELLDVPQALLRARDALLLEWLSAIPPRVDLADQSAVTARRQVVQRACGRARQWMHEHPGPAPTLLQLCRAVGTSPRTLDQCFREVLGLSPARYLRLSRLNAVRRALRHTPADEAGVQDLAARWGFWHAGAFAADYRRLFGERPSDTPRP